MNWLLGIEHKRLGLLCRVVSFIPVDVNVTDRKLGKRTCRQTELSSDVAKQCPARKCYTQTARAITGVMLIPL